MYYKSACLLYGWYESYSTLLTWLSPFESAWEIRNQTGKGTSFTPSIPSLLVSNACKNRSKLGRPPTGPPTGRCADASTATTMIAMKAIIQLNQFHGLIIIHLEKSFLTVGSTWKYCKASSSKGRVEYPAPKVTHWQNFLSGVEKELKKGSEEKGSEEKGAFYINCRCWSPAATPMHRNGLRPLINITTSVSHRSPAATPILKHNLISRTFTIIYAWYNTLEVL